MLSKDLWLKCTKEKIKVPEHSANTTLRRHGGGY